jgi:hypothetical protein
VVTAVLAGQIAMLMLALAADWLQIVSVDTTVLAVLGTVYNVVTVLALGVFCPRTLYDVGMFDYPPMSINGLIESPAAGVVAASVVAIFTK